MGDGRHVVPAKLLDDAEQVLRLVGQIGERRRSRPYAQVGMSYCLTSGAAPEDERLAPQTGLSSDYSTVSTICTDSWQHGRSATLVALEDGTISRPVSP
jgi:hypothetical protein